MAPMAIFWRKLSSVLKDLGIGIVCAPRVVESHDKDFGGKLPENNRQFAWPRADRSSPFRTCSADFVTRPFDRPENRVFQRPATAGLGVNTLHVREGRDFHP